MFLRLLEIFLLVLFSLEIAIPLILGIKVFPIIRSIVIGRKLAIVRLKIEKEVNNKILKEKEKEYEELKNEKES